MNKISSVQAAALAFCFALTRMIAFRPQGENMLICIISETAACAVLAALALAADSLPRLRDGLLAKFCAALGAVYYLFAAVILLVVFAESMQYSFPDFYASWVLIVSLAAGAAYCASMGFSGVGRTALTAVLLSLLVLILTGAGAVSGIDMTGLHLAVTDRNERLVQHFIRVLAYSFELPLLFTLRGRIDKPRRAAVIYCIARAIMWAVMLALCATVLGDQAEHGLPFFTLAAYSKTTLIERFDAAVLLMWTLCTLLAVTMLISGISECAARQKKLTPRSAGTLSAVIAAVAACGAMWSFSLNDNASHMWFAVILLIILVPAALTGRRLSE